MAPAPTWHLLQHGTCSNMARPCRRNILGTPTPQAASAGDTRAHLRDVPAPDAVGRGAHLVLPGGRHVAAQRHAVPAATLPAHLGVTHVFPEGLDAVFHKHRGHLQRVRRMVGAWMHGEAGARQVRMGDTMVGQHGDSALASMWLLRVGWGCCCCVLEAPNCEAWLVCPLAESRQCGAKGRRRSLCILEAQASRLACAGAAVHTAPTWMPCWQAARWKAASSSCARPLWRMAGSVPRYCTCRSTMWCRHMMVGAGGRHVMAWLHGLPCEGGGGGGVKGS